MSVPPKRFHAGVEVRRNATDFPEPLILMLRAAVICCALVFSAAATAQTTEELKASAYDKALAAEAAREQVAAAAKDLAAAEEAAAEAAAAVETAERESAVRASDGVDRAAIEEIRNQVAVVQKRADEAIAAVEALQKRLAYDRSGAYIGVSVSWVPEIFDTDFDVDHSKGVAAWLGVRFARRFALELRADRLDEFEFSGFGLKGSVDGWEITGNAKYFFTTQRFQPYFALGAGAFVSHFKAREVATGARASERDRSFVLRSGLGADYYLTPNVALGLEASLSSVGGDLESVRYAKLGGGLTFRF